MLSWFKPKCPCENEYVTLRKRITELELLADEYASFQENMRNMARKIQKPKTYKEEEQENIKDKIILAE